MPTRLNITALAAALATGTSGAAVAQHSCPAGYTYCGGVCQPVPAPASAYPAYPSGALSGAAAGRASGAAAGNAQPVPLAASSALRSARLRVRLPAPSTRSQGAPRPLRRVAQDTCITPAAAIRHAIN
jgi:hypothetical protein